jgi:parvulin-like peptidyl-prolyl isomerase
MNNSTVTAGILVALAFSAVASDAIAQTKTSPQSAAPARAATPPATPATSAKPTPSSAADDRGAVKGSEIIARVGESDVTAEEVRAALASLDSRQQAAVARDPALLSQTVRAILANRLVLKEALTKKWDQQPAVAAQLARARDNQIVETYLQSLTAPPESYPGEADIKSVYDANATAFLVPRRFQLAQILVAVAKDADKTAEDVARKKLDDLLKKAKQPGADFAALARSGSDDAATAERDGEIGWVAEPDLRPEIRSQVIGLAKAAITDPVRLDDGWHILKMLDTEASHTRSLAEVRDALVQRIRAERAEANHRAYIAELFKQTPPVVNEIALSKLLDAKSDAPPAR